MIHLIDKKHLKKHCCNRQFVWTCAKDESAGPWVWRLLGRKAWFLDYLKPPARAWSPLPRFTMPGSLLGSISQMGDADRAKTAYRRVSIRSGELARPSSRRDRGAERRQSSATRRLRRTVCRIAGRSWQSCWEAKNDYNSGHAVSSQAKRRNANGESHIQRRLRRLRATRNHL